MNHLEIREILQFAINAIDNETLWEKHYENLREIEKDLPELVKKDKANENAEMPDSLDKLKISDFLRLELKVYEVTTSDNIMDKTIGQIEQIFIPGVFNFRERLKLTLCAACHIDKQMEFVNQIYKYDEITTNFKKLKGIKFEANVSDVATNTQNAIDNLRQKQEEISKKENDYSTMKSEHDNVFDKLSSKGGIILRSNTAKNSKLSGGDSTSKSPSIAINSIFDTKKFKDLEGPDPITVFRDNYEKFISDDSNETAKENAKEKMFECLDWISFSKIGKKRPANKEHVLNILNILKNNFIEYVKKELKSLQLEDTEDIMRTLEQKIQVWNFREFSSYLNSFYIFGRTVKVKATYGKLTLVKNKNDFQKLYRYTPIGLFAEQLTNAVEETKGEETKKSQETFDEYIRQLFQKLYIDLMVEHGISNIIDEEITKLTNNAKHEGRRRDITNRTFNKSDDPLLRMLLLFVRDCVHTISMKITDEILKASEDDFWDRLEESLGNHISLKDETIKCDGSRSDTSLFEYIKKKLEDRGNIDDDVVTLLVNKTQLIYFLQNYKCF